MIRICRIWWFVHTPEFLFSWCDFLLLPILFNIDLCGPTFLGFSVGCITTLVKTTLSNRLVVDSTWLGVNWSKKLRTEWSLYFEIVDKWLLFISNSLKFKRDNLNLVDWWIISYWQQILAPSIQVCLRGEGDVYPLLPLTIYIYIYIYIFSFLCKGDSILTISPALIQHF